MIIGSISENKDIEKRVSITPEIAKKYINLGFEINLSENYGKHLGFEEKEYAELGVKFISDDKKLIENSDIIVQMSLPDDNKTNFLKSNQTLIGVLNSYENKSKLEGLAKKGVNLFSLELLPRITRAQSMDILSSQANLAGYKAVLESFSIFEKAIPMMMTAAGTISAAKVLVVGAGVAGLQAIATAKRMGAIVFATDVRMTSKEQVESLGGKFLTVDGVENLETEGGYAKEASEEFKKKQKELLAETLKKIDIVICTALIPGKKAPLIITENTSTQPEVDNYYWTQLGLDIDGDYPYIDGERSGSAVSINDNGSIIAIGAHRNDANGISAGQVKIFEWNGVSWNQLGQDILGDQSEDHTGYSVSINNNMPFFLVKDLTFFKKFSVGGTFLSTSIFTAQISFLFLFIIFSN